MQQYGHYNWAPLFILLYPGQTVGRKSSAQLRRYDHFLGRSLLDEKQRNYKYDVIMASWYKSRVWLVDWNLNADIFVLLIVSLEHFQSPNYSSHLTTLDHLDWLIFKLINGD